MKDAGARWFAAVWAERSGGEASQHPSGEYAMSLLVYRKRCRSGSTSTLPARGLTVFA
jgi:hypothetical protein